MLRALALSLAALGAARAWPYGERIRNLVQFGDSYTDSTVWIATNGTSWGEYLAGYAGLELYNFAYSGATCDNKSTPRTFPDIKVDEMNAYYNLTNHTTLPADETLYTIWIGTNDIGAGQLLTGQSTPGVSIVNVSQCAADVVRTLYAHGARKFLFQNMLPLDEAPMYAANAYPDRYWTAVRNTTGWNIFMKELVAAGNELTRLYIANLAPKLPGATIGYFDSHGFWNDMYTHPSKYLNGTAPLNVTSSVAACVFATNESTGVTGDCTWTTAPAKKDSFLWADELHPSEQADRQLAQQIYGILAGKSTRWVTFYHG